MPTKIKVLLRSHNGMKWKDISFEADIVHSDGMTEHDIVALIFACEFAINNKASEIIGESVRAHITLE